MDLEKAQKHIRNAWIAGLVFGTHILVQSLLTLAGITPHLVNNANTSLLYTIVIYILTLGIYDRKRICAVLMLLILLIHSLPVIAGLVSPTFTTIPIQGVKLLVVIATIYFCFQGERGILVYNRNAINEKGHRATSFKKILIGIVLTIGCIIGLVALMSFMTGKSYSEKERYRMVGCKINLKQIGLGMIMYANEHDEKFPDKLSKLYPEYINNIKVFFYNDEKKKIITPENIDSLGCFECVSGLTQADDPNTTIVREKSNNHWKAHGSGRYEVLLDGHIEWTGKPLPPIQQR